MIKVGTEHLTEWFGELWHFPFLAEVWGTGAEWFSGIASLTAVAVALWQSLVIRKQAAADAKNAADQFQREIDAANQRTIDEVQAAEQRSQLELSAANKRHEVEMEQQRELARTQRVALYEQEFKLALIRVSKAASAYSHELATLVSATGRICQLQTRQERDDAITPLAKKRNLASTDLTLEVSGAHMLTNNNSVHAVMNPIIAAGVEAATAASNYENAIIFEGQLPNQQPIYSAMAKLSEAVGQARQLVAEELVTGWS